MRTKKRTRVIALLSILSLLMTYVSYPKRDIQAAGNTPAATEEAGTVYEKTTFSDFGIADKTIDNTTELYETGQGFLQNVSVEGIYHFSYGGNAVYFGGNWQGIRMEPKAGNLSFMYVDLAQDTDEKKYRTLGEITPAEAECTLAEADVKIQIGFSFSNVTETTADVTVTVTVAENYRKTYTVEQANKYVFAKTMMLWAAQDSPMTIASVEHYTVFGFDDFGFDRITTAGGGNKTCVTGTMAKDTLDNVSIVGQYLFSAGGNRIYYGGNWQGFVVMPSGENLVFAYMDLNQQTENQWKELATLTPKEAGTKLVEDYVKLQITFAFSDICYETTPDTAHVTITVSVNDTYETTFNLSDARTDTFLSRIMFWSESSLAPMSYHSVITDTSLTLLDFGISDGTLENETVLYEQSAATLDRVRIDGYYHFPESDSQVCFGGDQEGFILAPAGKDILQIFYKEGENKRLLGEITPEETKYSLTKVDVKLRTEFSYSNINAGYADVKMTVMVQDTNRKSFTATGISINALKRQITVCTENDETSCTIKALDWQEDVFEGFLTVTPSDFGILDGDYNYTDTNLAADGILENQYTATGAMTLDRKAFSTEVSFKGNDAQIRIGGVNAASEGILFKRKNNTQFELAECQEMGLHSQTFDISRAGLASIDDTFQLKLSFEFVDRDCDGQKDDVKYGVWFNDRLYANTYFYALDKVSHLGMRLGIYLAGEDAEIEIASQQRVKEDTPYILEDAGISEQVYKEIYQGAIAGMNLTNSSVSGKIALSGNANIILYGMDTNAWLGYRLSLVNGVVALSHSNDAFGVIAQTNVKEGEEFSFSIGQQLIDADADGLEDDIRLSLWVNQELYRNQYFYLLDYVNYTGTGVVLYPDNRDVESAICVKDSVREELYNLADREYGYLIVGKGSITVNGAETVSGNTLTVPGDYTIRCAGQGAYVKRVILYVSGDAHPDGVLDVKDLVAAKKTSEAVGLATRSGEESSDINRDGIVDEDDLSAIRLHLTGKEEMSAVTDYYLTYEEDVMPIAGYHGPYRETVTTDIRGTVTYDYLNDKTYRLIKQAGVNLIYSMSNSYTSEPEIVQKACELAQKYDLGIYVKDDNMNTQRNDAQLAGFIENYASYTSFRGTFVVDEPVTKDYGYQYYENGTLGKVEDCADKGKMLNNYANMIGAVNLNPISKSLVKPENQENYKDCYRTYIDDYVRLHQPKLLSFDYYVFDEITGSQQYATKKGYFENLSVMREKSLQYCIPFWSFIQVGSYWNGNGSEMIQTNNTTPTQGQMLWNVNTSLAFGAKGIVYFPLVQPYYFAYQEGGGYEARNGLIGVTGEATQWYAYAQKANQQIAAVDEVLLNATSEQILWKGNDVENVLGESATGDGAALNSIGTEAGSSAIVGVFTCRKKTAYYVVNYDTEYGREVQLNFSGKKSYHVISEQLSEPCAEQEASICPLHLQAGGAALVIVE